MTVFFDFRYTRPENMDGITRYSMQMFAALMRLRPVTALICSSEQVELLPAQASYLMVNKPTSPKELLLARELNRRRASVVFSPMQTTSGLGRRYKLISTVHDLIYYRRPKAPTFLPFAVRVIWRLYHLGFAPQRLLLRQSDALVTVSETTKRDILNARLWPQVKPLRIASPAFDSKVFKTAADDIDLPREKKVLVFAGSYMPYKGVETIVRALAELTDYELHLLSPASSAVQSQLRQIAGVGSLRLKFLGGLEDSDYAALLCDSKAFVTASIDEGFGIPLIEAMACGTPVVCSDIAVFREVAGDAAEFFEPGNPVALAEAIKRLKPKRLNALRAKGLARSRQFDWDVSAKVISDLIDELRR